MEMVAAVLFLLQSGALPAMSDSGVVKFLMAVLYLQ
jgi:hypothetical protein